MYRAVSAVISAQIPRGRDLESRCGWYHAVWCAAVALLCCSPARAGTVTVNVTDPAGQPLPQAVVLIEPVTGKLPVSPMAMVQVAQTKRQFVPRVSVVTVGTSVAFPNQDTVRHHVYSFSPTKNFELKLYAGVPAQPVLFDKAGIAVLGCNIHDQMAAWIVVVDTPYHAVSGADGTARIPAVAAGSYQLKVWHPGLPGASDGVSQPLTATVANIDKAVRLPIDANPLVLQP
ncbi:MAG: methylamine utilization protein [Burkholderiaceae bacterium]|nr:methylamine utilization protein [Burkholderiaceae bacterium]